MSKTPDEKLAEELIKDAKALGIDTDEILNKDEEEKKPEDLAPETEKKKEEEDKEEKPKDDPEAEKSKKSEEDEAKSKSRIPKKEEDKDEDDSSGDDDEDDEEDESKAKKPKLVPYKKVRKLKERHKQEIATLQDQLTKATTKEEVDDVEQAIQEFAKKTEADPAVVKELISIIQKAGTKKPEKKDEEEHDDLDDLDEEDEDDSPKKEKKIDPTLDVKAEQEYFDNEWKTYVPKIQEQYPNLTEGQIAKAKDLMDKLSHTQKYVAVPDLGYILYAEKAQFDEILASPKKKSLDSSDASMKREEIIEEDLSKKDLENMSAEDILKLDNKMKNIQRQHSSTKLLDM